LFFEDQYNTYSFEDGKKEYREQQNLNYTTIYLNVQNPKDTFISM